VHTKCQPDDRKGRYHLADLIVSVRTKLKQILKIQGVKMWPGFDCLRTGLSDSSCERGNQHSCQ
jgi:hypothetical protein